MFVFSLLICDVVIEGREETRIVHDVDDISEW